MNAIFNALWRTIVLLWVSIIQLIAAITGGIALLFGKCCGWLRKFSGRALSKLDEGKYAANMKTIAEN